MAISTLQPARGYTLVEATVVAGIIAVLSAVAVPMSGNMLKNYRVSGDAHGLYNTVALAKMRSAASFTRTRVYVDLTHGTFALQAYRDGATPVWVADGGTVTLSSGVAFSFSTLDTAPPNTQSTIAQAPACQTVGGADIVHTACIIFNTRGIPVDSSGAPTGVDAFYLSDGTSVFGVTVAATGLIRTWQSPAATVRWSKQ